jgi:hypothetical protein
MLHIYTFSNSFYIAPKVLWGYKTKKTILKRTYDETAS